MKDSTKSRWWASRGGPLVLWNGAWKRLSLWIIQRPMKNSRNERQSKLHRAYKEIRIIVHIGWAEGRKEDTRDMKFWSQVYVGSGIGSYPDPAGTGRPVASECVKTWLTKGSIARLIPIFIFPLIKINFLPNAILVDDLRWPSKHWKRKRKKERRRRKTCIFILIYANTKRVSLCIRSTETRIL